MKNKLGWALAILVTGTLVLGATGCGGDDDDSSQNGTAVSSCQTFCNKEKDCDPNTTVGNINFGRVTSQANSPRQIQLALKLTF